MKKVKVESWKTNERQAWFVLFLFGGYLVLTFINCFVYKEIFSSIFFSSLMICHLIMCVALIIRRDIKLNLLRHKK